ncbi:hypothetical protein QUB09_18885, partial [Microcoleus sp. C2C6]|uniref:hypothetical protein n=1 Tax=Microcoleus sp. C2C6 TaxID=3055325 RepID=UPI002FD55344
MNRLSGLFHNKKIHLLWNGTGFPACSTTRKFIFCGTEQAFRPVPQQENSSLVERNRLSGLF